MSNELINPGPSWETIPQENLPELSRAVVKEFEADLDNALIDGSIVVNPVEYADHLDDSKPFNTQLIKRVMEAAEVQPKRILLSSEYGWLRKHDMHDVSVLRTGKAETSAHLVFFALIHDAHGGGSIPLAIKPYDKNPTTAYADWINNDLAAKEQERHFNPVALMMGRAMNYSITELDRSVETLDNSNWLSVLNDPTDDEYSVQRETLKETGRVLARLHAKNIVHGDPQFKNIALDLAGNVFMIDWEAATFFPKDEVSDRRIKRSAHDLIVLFQSMAFSEDNYGVGLLTPFTPQTQWLYFKEFVFDPYMETFLEEDPRPNAAFDHIADVEEMVYEYIHKDELAAGLVEDLNSVKIHRTA